MRAVQEDTGTRQRPPAGGRRDRARPSSLLAALALAAGLALGFALGDRMGAPPALAAAPAALSLPAHQYPDWVRRLTASPPSRGQRGATVLALQRLLFSLGYDVAMDGAYGPETQGAVSRFQAQNGLKVTGSAEAATVKRLVESTWWYPVRAGDTLSGVAAVYGTTVATLRRLNGLQGDAIRAGQRLLVPRAGVGGTVGEWGRYRVRPGDTLWSVARRFQVPYDALQRVNAILDPRDLKAGQLLWLPSRPSPGPPRPAEPRLLAWPAEGEITSGYGWRTDPFGGRTREFHEGLDIAVPPGTPVRAAAGGMVVQAGWMGEFGYGVVIDHGSGVQTLYGHLRRIAVRVGQRVQRGQVIAWSGSSGRSTGPHLDFRVKVNGKSVDPLTMLSPR